MISSRSRHRRTAGGLLAASVVAGVALVASQASAQEGQRSASISVSVTVVRSCSVSAPASTAQTAGAAGQVRLSCAPGRQTSLPLSAIGLAQTLTQVAGAQVNPGVSATRTDGLVVLHVNF